MKRWTRANVSGSIRVGSFALALAGCSASSPPPREEPTTEGLANASVHEPIRAPNGPSGTSTTASTAAARCFAEPLQLDKRAKPPRIVAGNLDERLHGCASSAERDRCELDVAQTYYEAGHPLVAAPIARRIALATRDREAGEAAAQLELETLNEIGSHAFPPRSECYDVMATDVGPLLDINCRCEPTEAKKPTPLCDTLHRIELDLERLTAEKIVTTAQRSGTADSLYADASDAYWALFVRHCTARCGATPAPNELLARRCDEIAFNGYRAGLAGHDLRRATRARDALLAPEGGLAGSPLAEKVRNEPLPGPTPR